MPTKPLIKVEPHSSAATHLNNSRRHFLKMSGLAVAGAGFLISCSSDDDFSEPIDPNAEVFDLGSGDLGILNYAYALEQLEAAFYTNVLDGSYWMNANAGEKKDPGGSVQARSDTS